MNNKIKISPQIGSQLKEYRIEHQKKSKDVATFIEKSPAYITKLEKGQIKKIDKNLLVKITNYISDTNDGYYQFCEKIASTADSNMLEHETLLLNFDLIERQIPISSDVIDELKNRIKSLNISVDDLTKYINQNEDLGDNFFNEHKIDVNSIEHNIWIHYNEADMNETYRNFIVLDYKTDRIEKLLNGDIHKCEYMFPFAILYHLLKLQYKNKGSVLDDNLMNQCQKEAENILLNHKFYSLSVQSRILAQSNTKEECEKILSDFDVDNSKYIVQILNYIQILSNYDVEYTNNKLINIVENFEKCDPSFILAFMATPLVKTQNLQPSLKKEFLDQVKDLVEKYSTLVNSSENIEKY